MISISVCEADRPGAIHLFQKGGILSECDELVSISADDWFTKGCSMCYHICVIIRVKDPWLSVVRVGHRFLLADFCLSLPACAEQGR